MEKLPEKTSSIPWLITTTMLFCIVVLVLIGRENMAMVIDRLFKLIYKLL